MEKKNIIKWEHLQQAAFNSGLDSARLLRDFEDKAKERFNEDLALAKIMDVHSFPTLFFSDSSGEQIKLKGLQPYENLKRSFFR